MRKAPSSINRISGIQQFQLMQYVQANYASSRLLDKPFADKAAAELGFPVTVSNVQGCREAFGTEANRDILRREACEPRTRLDRIEARLAAIEAWIKAFDPKAAL